MVTALLAVGGYGCSSAPARTDASVVDAGDASTPTDAGPGVDSGTDAGPLVDGGVSNLTGGSGFDMTAGSGVVTSTSFAIRLNVSAPLPIGASSSPNYHVVLGPRVPR